jgi:hypothetical protein
MERDLLGATLDVHSDDVAGPLRGKHGRKRETGYSPSRQRVLIEA